MIDRETLLKQAEEMQKKMEEAEKSLADQKVYAESGGGLVSIEGTANGHISSVFLDPSLFSSESRQVSEDLLKTAFNNFQKNVAEAARTLSSTLLRS